MDVTLCTRCPTTVDLSGSCNIATSQESLEKLKISAATKLQHNQDSEQQLEKKQFISIQ